MGAFKLEISWQRGPVLPVASTVQQQQGGEQSEGAEGQAGVASKFDRDVGWDGSGLRQHLGKRSLTLPAPDKPGALPVRGKWQHTVRMLPTSGTVMAAAVT